MCLWVGPLRNTGLWFLLGEASGRGAQRALGKVRCLASRSPFPGEGRG